MSYQIRCDGLPLAVYREVAAHLGQVQGISVVIVPQQSQQFDYGLSQVGSLLIDDTNVSNPEERQRVQQILAYYGDRYGSWNVEKTEGGVRSPE